jgi:PAS domain S-box-containing protein
MSLEEVLEDSRDLFEALFEHAEQSVVILDRELRVRRFNRTFADTLGVYSLATTGPVTIGHGFHEYVSAGEEEVREFFGPTLAGKTRQLRSVATDPNDPQRPGFWDLLITPLRSYGQVVGLITVATDSTERTSAQLRLRSQERLHRSILDNAKDPIAVIDANGIVTYSAPASERVLDVSRPSVGAPITEPVHPDDLAAAQAWLAERIRGLGDNSPLRCRLRLREGGWHTFEVSSINLLDDPDVEGIVVSARDVTEREHAEHQLRSRDAILGAVRIAAQLFLESRSSWRDSVDHVMSLLGEASTSSRVYIFENYVGDDGALMTQQTHEWVAPDIEPQIDNPELIELSYESPAMAASPLNRLRSGRVVSGNVVDFEREARELLEPQDIVSIALMPIFVEAEYWGFIGFDECTRKRNWSAAEIDALQAAASTLAAAVQRQRAEEVLREQQAQYRQVFDTTGDGLVVTDIHYRLIAANPAFHRMHGYEPGELAGTNSLTWIHPDHHDVLESYRDAILRGENPQLQALDVRKDGSSFPVQVHGAGFTLNGQPQLLGVVHDDTERARALELLENRVSALATIAASLTVNQPFDTTMNTVTSAVIKAMPVAASAVCIFDSDGRPQRMAATSGHPPGYADAVERSWHRGGGVTQLLTDDVESVVITDALAKMLAMPECAPIHDMLRTACWSTVVIVRLQSQGRSFGSLQVYYPDKTAPSDDDMAFLRAVADQCTVAVDNARLLSEAQSRAGLEERQRLARDLHDSVSQALYGIALGARTAKKVLANGATDQLVEPLDYILSLAQAGMTEMRSLIFELRPESLEQEGLVAALERRLAALRDRHELGVTASLGAEPTVPLPIKETLYRIAQEAMHNTVKHAHARTIRLELRTSQERIEMEIADDGVGFGIGVSSESRAGHLGLQSMRERAEAHAGSCELRSAAGQGTVIAIRLPLPDSAVSEPVPDRPT